MTTTTSVCSQWIDITIERADGTTERMCIPASMRYEGGVQVISGRIQESAIATEVARLEYSIASINHVQEPKT